MPGGQVYRVEVYSDFWDALERLPKSQQARVTEFMARHFAVRPRVIIPGQLKRLKGNHSGLFQLNAGKNRLLYEVEDVPERVVRIVYLGPHPDWKKRGKIRN